MANKKLKTSNSTRKAIEKYNEKFERLTVRLPVGTSEKIKARGYSINGYINQLIENDLNKKENNSSK